MLTEAHTAKNGEVREKFNSAFHMFVASRGGTSKLERGTPKPKLSTIQEHFRKLIRIPEHEIVLIWLHVASTRRTEI